MLTEFSPDLLKTSSTAANGRQRRRQQAHRDREGEQRLSGVNFSGVKQIVVCVRGVTTTFFHAATTLLASLVCVSAWLQRWDVF